MDMSFADQALSAEYMVKNYKTLEKRVYRVPDDLDKRVAKLKLESVGIKIDQAHAGAGRVFGGLVRRNVTSEVPSLRRRCHSGSEAAFFFRAARNCSPALSPASTLSFKSFRGTLGRARTSATLNYAHLHLC